MTISLAVALTTFPLLHGCGRNPGEAGQKVAVEEAGPRRVVVIAPAAAEMMEALGLLDRVVGIGEFGPWPSSIADLPVVGGYDGPNLERVLDLGCDLLLTAYSEAGFAAHQRLESLGVRVLALDTSTFDGVFTSLEQVGLVFDRGEEAEALQRAIRDELREIAVRAEGLDRRLVLFVVGRDPVFVAGPGSHVDEMITLVGGRNAAQDALSPYQQFSIEAVLERAPEVIIDVSDNRPGATRGRRAGAWGQWSFLPAVRDRRVYRVDPGRLAIPGLRLPEMTRLMGRLVHPEVFGEPDDGEMGPLAARTKHDPA